MNWFAFAIIFSSTISLLHNDNRPYRVGGVTLTTEVPLRVGRVVDATVAEGPGLRYAIWVAGCTIRCSGCFNPHLWAARGTPMSPQSLVRRAVSNGVEGISLLGGEPFEQAAAGAQLARFAQEAGLGMMVFSGYTLVELRKKADTDTGICGLLHHTDLLLDGRYEADHPDHTRPWVGSTNQDFHFLTPRYRYLADQLTTVTDRLEIRIAPNGELAINGWADVDQLDTLLSETQTPAVKRGMIR